MMTGSGSGVFAAFGTRAAENVRCRAVGGATGAEVVESVRCEFFR
jgi:hypothetical protein